MSNKTLCLNMIVKNEMANLERCLGSIVEHIGCWVVCDTGSTDGTQDFIKSFFGKRNVPGELHSYPFENFEQARNTALDYAAASLLPYDYLLLADADMELVVEDQGFRKRLEGPGYRLIAADWVRNVVLEHAPCAKEFRCPLPRSDTRVSCCSGRRKELQRFMVQGSREWLEPHRQVST